MREGTEWQCGRLASSRGAAEQRRSFRFPAAEDGVLIVDADTGRVLQALPLAAARPRSGDDAS